MKLLPAWLFIAIASALVIGCGGGASSGSSYTPPGGGTATQPPQAVKAHVTLRIPRYAAYAAARSRRLRAIGNRPNYISPGTASVAFAVTPVVSGAASTPLPVQVLNVVTPEPCSTVTPSGLQCTYDVSVMAGTDSIGVTTYPSPNAVGSPLAIFVPAMVNIPTPGPSGSTPPLQFTLAGVVASVSFTFSEPTEAPNQAYIPALVAAPVSIQAHVLDASGYEILEPAPSGSATAQPYSQSFTIANEVPNRGLTLSNQTQSGVQSLTIHGPADLQGLTANYDGTLSEATQGQVVLGWGILASGGTIAGSDHSLRAAAKAAKYGVKHVRSAMAGVAGGTRHPAGPAPTPSPEPDVAYIYLKSAITSHGVAFGLSPSSPPAGVAIEPDGTDLFWAVAQIGAAVIGTFNIPSNALLYTNGTTSYTPSRPYADSFGNLWLLDASGQQFHCYASNAAVSSGGSGFSESVATVYSGAFAEPVAMTDDGTYQYFAFYGYGSPSAISGVGYDQVGSSCQRASGAAFAEVDNLNEPSQYSWISQMMGITKNASSGAIFAVATAGPDFVGTVAVATPTPQATNYPVSQTLTSLGSGGGVTVAGDGSQLYTISGGTVTQYGTVIPTPNALSTMDPLGVNASSGTPIAVAQTMFAVPGVVIAGPTVNHEAVLPGTPYLTATGTGFAASCRGAVFDSVGTLWTLCFDGVGTQAASLYRIAAMSGWTIFPQSETITIQSGCTATLPIAALESGDSGPFTTSSSNETVTGGEPVDSGDHHDFTVTLSGSFTGASTVTLTDAYGRSESTTITVSNPAAYAPYGCQHNISEPRPAHARPGKPRTIE